MTTAEVKTSDGQFTIFNDGDLPSGSLFDENGNLANSFYFTGSDKDQTLQLTPSREKPGEADIGQALGGDDTPSDGTNYTFIEGGSFHLTLTPSAPPSTEDGTGGEQQEEKQEEKKEEKKEEQPTEQEQRETLSSGARSLMQQAQDLGVNVGFTREFLESKLKDATVEELQNLQYGLQYLLRLAQAPGSSSDLKTPGEQDGPEPSNNGTPTSNEVSANDNMKPGSGKEKTETKGTTDSNGTSSNVPTGTDLITSYQKNGGATDVELTFDVGDSYAGYAYTVYVKLGEELQEQQAIANPSVPGLPGSGQIGAGRVGAGGAAQAPVSFLLPDARITPHSAVAVLHKVNGKWQREMTLPGDGFVIVLGVESFSPFALVADPATLAVPQRPARCAFRPESAQVQNGVLLAQAAASGVQTALDLAKELVKQSGAVYSGLALELDLTAPAAAFEDCALTLSRDACKKLDQAGVTRLDVTTRQFSLSLDAAALKVLAAAKGDVILRAEQAETPSDSALAARPAYQLTAESGGKELPLFAQGSVTLSLPCAPQPGERAGALALALVEGGVAKSLPASVYSPEDKAVLGQITQSGVYGIVQNAAPAFPDVPAVHWAADDVAFASARGYLTGAASGTFNPDAVMTRGMLLAVLHRLAGSPQAAGEGGAFSDVPGTAYYADAVRWAASVGILNKKAAAFSPYAPVTRQDLAVLLQNYVLALGLDLPQTRELADFADRDTMVAWAWDAVRTLQMAGVINGKPDNRFDPDGPVTRAQFAAVLRRFAEVTVKH